MIIVVDGYNVLKQVIAEKEIAANQRAAFIKKMGIYARKKGHAVVIVFDGGQSSWPEKEKMHGCTVIYAGYERSADAYIQDYLEEHKHRDIVLVSTDRELDSFAWDLSIQTIDAIDFYNLATRVCDQEADALSLREKSKTIKLTQQEIPELDELMYSSEEYSEKKDDVLLVSARTSPHKKHSKKERRMRKTLKKL